MKPTELRIGNYISVENEKHRPELKGLIIEVNSITNLNGHDFAIGLNLPSDEDGYYQTTSQFIKFIKPIPLTEEWLLKFGWKIDYELRGIKIFINHELDIDSINYIIDKNIFYFNCWENTKCPQSVHQLQNLYFALTGEELTIK